MNDLRILIRGLRVRARIGVSDAEREVERPLAIDLDLTPAHGKAGTTDELADTVDYAAAAALVEEIAAETPYRTLERLASRLADALLELPGCAVAEVRVAKPDPPMAQSVDHVAVRVRGEVE